GLRFNCAGARDAAQGTHPALHGSSVFPRQEANTGLQQQNGISPLNYFALPCEIERDDGNLLRLNVEPDVQLGPVGERENANAVALIMAAVIEVPQCRPLVLGVPLALCVAK